MTRIFALPGETHGLLADAQALGFDKLYYSLDALDGDIDPPLEAASWGVSGEFWERYLDGIRQDSLRRMTARGEIVVANTPICFENDGASLSIARQRRFHANLCRPEHPHRPAERERCGLGASSPFWRRRWGGKLVRGPLA